MNFFLVTLFFFSILSTHLDLFCGNSGTTEERGSSAENEESEDRRLLSSVIGSRRLDCPIQNVCSIKIDPLGEFLFAESLNQSHCDCQ